MGDGSRDDGDGGSAISIGGGGGEAKGWETEIPGGNEEVCWGEELIGGVNEAEGRKGGGHCWGKETKAK